jgi:hypothetical protein
MANGAAIYIDGQLKSSASTPTYSIAHDSTALALGTETTSGAKDVWFKGIIDEAMVFNKALSSQDIAQLHNGNLNALPTPTLDLSCTSSTSFSAFKVTISGKLSVNDAGIYGVPILLSYSVNGGNSWQDLTLVNTGSLGYFQAEWRPSVTGNYLIKAIYEGNDDFSEASQTVNLAVTSYAEDVFSINTNSTISNLRFNSASKQLSFSVTGPSNTNGYANVNIAKTIIQDSSNIKVYLDGNNVDYTAASTEDSWLLHFTYQHSTHEVTVNLANSTLLGGNQLGNWVIYIVIAFVVIAIVGVIIALKRKKTK